MKIRSHIHKNASGLTYIEILVAILVVGIIAPSIGGTMLSISRNATFSRELAQASFVLQSTADEVMIKRVTTDNANLATTGYNHPDLAVGTLTLPSVIFDGVTFSRTTQTVLIAPGTNDCPGGAAGDCKEVTITITTPSGVMVQSVEPLKNYALATCPGS